MELNKREFIINIFKNIENRNIKYCILRNYEKLPNDVGHDIDVLIDGKDIHNDIIDTLSLIVEQLGWQSLINYNKDSFFTMICYKVTKDSVEILKLDVWTDLCWRGISWIDTKLVIDTRIKYNEIYIPNNGCEAAVTSIKELIGGGDIPKKYYEKITLNAKGNKDIINNVFNKSFGIYSNIIVEKIISGDFQSLNSMKNKLKRQLLVNNLNCYIHNSFDRLKTRIHNLFISPGKLIAFIGPDGSGKTTLINIEENYLKLIFPRIVRYHIRFNLFPELKTGFGLSSMKGKLNKTENEQINTKLEPKVIKRSLISKIASWLVVFYYSFEFLIGRIIIKMHKKNNSVILFDRYYYDFFAQPTTRELINKHKKLLFVFAKKPDIIIHLNANPEVVYKRKQELSVCEINKQNYYLGEVIRDQKGAFTIDTDSKTEREIASEIFQIIVDDFKSKVRI
jgi:thymidylate kinase